MILTDQTQQTKRRHVAAAATVMDPFFSGEHIGLRRVLSALWDAAYRRGLKDAGAEKNGPQ